MREENPKVRVGHLSKVFGGQPHAALERLEAGASKEEILKETGSVIAVSDVTGCVDDPCEMGWPANDLRPVVNNAFLNKNPAAKRLFEVMEIPLLDIFAQNAKMQGGEDKEEDIERHADAWIAANRQLFDDWLDAARKAAD